MSANGASPRGNTYNLDGLSIIATTTGRTYTFFLANDNPSGDPTETFAARWDGATVFSLPSPQASFGYSQRVVFNLTAT